MKLRPFLEVAAWLALGFTLGVGLTPVPKTGSVAPAHAPASSAATNHLFAAGADPFAAKAAQLDALLSEPDTFHELKELLAFVDQLTPAEFPLALAHLRSGPEDNRDSTADALIGRWAEIDPQGMVSAVGIARTMPDQEFGKRVLTDIYDAWAHLDLKGALDDARHSLAGEEQYTALATVLTTMAETDPAGAFAQTKGQPNDRSPWFVRPIFSSWASQNPGAATQTALKISDDYSRTEALSGIAGKLVQQDSQTAVAWANQLPAGKLRDSAINVVASEWSEIDPAATMKWLETMPSLPDKAKDEDDVAVTWCNRDAVGELKAGLALPPGKAHDSMLYYGLAQLSYDDAPAAARWAEALPDSQNKKNALSTVISFWSEYDGAAAAQYVFAMQKGDSQLDGVREAAGSWSRLDPRAAAQWMDNLPDPKLKGAAATVIADNMAQNDLPGATKWVATLPAGVVRDGAAGKLSTHLVHSDPTAAMTMAQSITDPELRQQTLTTVLQKWMRHDPDAAKKALNDASLPADVKAKILAAAPKPGELFIGHDYD